MKNRLMRSFGHRALAAFESVTTFDPVTRSAFSTSPSWQYLGTDECGWFAPTGWPVDDPICYCVGAGEDISFDLALSEMESARVFIFDPTPRAVRFVDEELITHPDITFKPWALWSEDGDVPLFVPRDASHVSHSIVNLQATEASILAESRRLTTIMEHFNHDHVDLLKLDVEGAEYAILEDLVRSGANVGIINVEFDELSWPKKGAWSRIRAAHENLTAHGYDLVLVDKVSNYTYAKQGYLSR